MPAYSVRSGRYYYNKVVDRYQQDNNTIRYRTSTFLKEWKTYKRMLHDGDISAPSSDGDVLYWLDRLNQVRLTGTSTTTTAAP